MWTGSPTAAHSRGRIGLAVALAAVTLVAGACRQAQNDASASANTLPARPGSEFFELAPSGAWCWFGDPRGVQFSGAHNRIYTGWVDAAGSIQVASLDLDTSERVQHTVHADFNKDDHASPSLLVLPDGTVVVFYTSHGSDVSDAMYYRLSLRPEDITAWGERLEVGSNADGPMGYTYPNPVRLSQENGRVYLFWRGGNFKPVFSYSDDLLSWAPAQTLIQSDEATDVRPYVKVATNNRDVIHFAFTDGHPRNEPQNSIYYLKYRDGEFTKADGSLVGDIEHLPLVHELADRVYDAERTDVRSWIWDVAEGTDGNPVVVYTRLPEEGDHRYHYARWTGTEWTDREITAGGGWFPRTPDGVTEPEPHYSGGIVLDHDDPSVLYVSRPRDGAFEIERWWTEDGGVTWRSTWVTEASINDNVRPFVVRDRQGSSSGLTWMENRHYRHYLDFDAVIRMEREPAPSSEVQINPDMTRDFTEEWEADGGGEWRVSNGTLALESAGVPVGPIRRPASLAVLRDHSFGTVVVDAEIRSTADPSVVRADVLLVFGYQSPTRFYYAHLSGIADDVHNGIFLVDGSDRRRIDDGQALPLLSDRSWHRVRLERETPTGRIAVFLDGAPEPGLTAMDLTLPSGAVGFGSFDDTAQFRRVSVRGGAAHAAR